MHLGLYLCQTCFVRIRWRQKLVNLESQTRFFYVNNLQLLVHIGAEYEIIKMVYNSVLFANIINIVKSIVYVRITVICMRNMKNLYKIQTKKILLKHASDSLFHYWGCLVGFKKIIFHLLCQSALFQLQSASFKDCFLCLWPFLI